MSRFLLLFQCLHPIITTVIGPFLLLIVLNFRIYRRYWYQPWHLLTDLMFILYPSGLRLNGYYSCSFIPQNVYLCYALIHRKDLHLTRIVFTIVVVFLLLNLPRLLLGVFEISRYLNLDWFIYNRIIYRLDIA